MTQITEALFWLAASLILYTYVLYPLLLAILARLLPRPAIPARQADELPFVSVLVAASDEEAVIPAKLANCRALDYPADRIEFLIGSDGSRDRTAGLVRAHAGPNVRLLAFPHRRGKAAVLNDLAAQARGSLLVFSDANSLFEPPAVRRLVRHFQNPRIGGVCGQLVLHPADKAAPGIANESLYWRYENFIKRQEGRLGRLASANGAIYAVRRALFRPLPADRPIADDLVVASAILAQNHWVTFEQDAVAREAAAARVHDDLRRKVRVGESAYNALPFIAPLLWPRRGVVAFMLWSHKVIRWAVPVLLLVVLIANLFLLNEPLYRLTLLAQAGMYAIAWIGFLLETRSAMPRWAAFPYYFAGANLALLLGLIRSLTRRRGDATWTQAGR